MIYVAYIPTMFAKRNEQVTQCVNEVYHEQEAASCVSGITWHVYLRLW